ncbi:protein TESPA1 isoform X2 [Antennarius striatus]|uniref:protein TESPA1 isoform X2 n=1 Tax=Antennarius striatus TaxID=241820 RepID=UPI0035B41F2A
MESPSSAVRRRAWINSSRQWNSPEELDPEEPFYNLPSASTADDDVFSDGCTTGKIESWLVSCGSKAYSTNSEPLLRNDQSEEELSLGADASVINVGGNVPETGFAEYLSSNRGRSRLTSSFLVCSASHQVLWFPAVNLGHSMASSCPSSSSCTSTSSLLEVLQLHSEDAEEILYELGFGCDEPQVTVRIPPRFFSFPSLAQGINFRLFLDSQLQRIREEDPSLSLASRFRQVQVLTTMANAFYSLYSHVSRTPLPKLAQPEFSFSSSPVERIERFRSSVRSEPRSPVERLKDTVSKMCLYTGSPRGSDSTSPQPSPKKRSSFPNVVDITFERVKFGVSEKLDCGQYDSCLALGVNIVTDGDKSCDRGDEEDPKHPSVANTDAPYIGNKMSHEETQDSRRTDCVVSDKGKVKVAARLTV